MTIAASAESVQFMAREASLRCTLAEDWPGRQGFQRPRPPSDQTFPPPTPQHGLTCLTSPSSMSDQAAMPETVTSPDSALPAWRTSTRIVGVTTLPSSGGEMSELSKWSCASKMQTLAVETCTHIQLRFQTGTIRSYDLHAILQVYHGKDGCFDGTNVRMMPAVRTASGV